jgi:uncharacterized NAD-dependent epimerase/dehydratase family protein
VNRRLLILTEGLSDPLSAKTAVCLVRYRPEQVVAILDSTRRGETTQSLWGIGGAIPVVGAVEDAPEANTLVIGIAPPGGRLPPPLRAAVLAALARGWNVESGLHEFLSDDAEFVEAAERNRAHLRDVRRNRERELANRRGIDERCLRIHTVGHDCSVGKMLTAVELTRKLNALGHDAKFVATGQTGILVEGDGCPIDCVVSDFVNGAAEKLVLANQSHEILLIEGQASVTHPRFSAVTTGLLHGSMPDGLIYCIELGRTHFRGMTEIPLPPLADSIRLTETLANVMHPCRTLGLAINSSRVSALEADAARDRLRRELALPVCDVLRHGPEELCHAILTFQRQIGKQRS